MTEVTVPFQLVTLENDENRMPLVQAELNGIPVSLVVDTGASHTCIDRSAFKRCTASRPDTPSRLRCSVDEGMSDTVMGLGGRRLSHSFDTIDVLRFGELEVRSYRVVLVRLANINRMLRLIGKDPIDGLLGCDLLSQYNVRMDFGTMTMIFCR